MAEPSMLAGPALRRLRRREGLTQAALASRLRISPSYLNLLERNQRPLTARVMVQVMNEFSFDPRELGAAANVGGTDGMARRLADERFQDLGIDRHEVDEFLQTSPQIAAAFARLFDSSGNTHGEERMAGRTDAVDRVRHEIERWRNHFADLDHAAEALADEMRLSRGDIAVALSERLRERHQLAVRILPGDVMPDARRRLDLHARQVQLNEMLPAASRSFQLAVQVAVLEQREAIVQLVAGAGFDDRTAGELMARHLERYFAAALIMPYGRFLRACEATGYDLPVLQRRFGVSFEQLGHRLTTLQRVGQRGLPFFLLRTDRAGQASKRLIGASGANFIDGAHPCPLWIATLAFERRGDLLAQTVNPVGGTGDAGTAHWFCLSRTVSQPTGAVHALTLGLEAEFAADLAHARGVSLVASAAIAIGPGCRRCHVANCPQRARPPAGARLHVDRVQDTLVPFVFDGAMAVPGTLAVS